MITIDSRLAGDIGRLILDVNIFRFTIAYMLFDR
jgi:hypothetical protein